MTELTKYAPPEHLSDRSKKLWRDVVPATGKRPRRLALVRAALEALDRADVARELIAVEGAVVRLPGGKMTHSHPSLKIESENRALFLRTWAGSICTGSDDDLHRSASNVKNGTVFAIRDLI